MTQSTNLDITLVDPNQTGKAITINEALEAFADTLSEELAVDASVATSPYTVPYSSAEGGDKEALRFLKLDVTGALVAGWTGIFPTKRHLFFAQNSTTGGQTLTLKCSGETGITLTPGEASLCYVNGTDVEKVPLTAAAGSIDDLTDVTLGGPSLDDVLTFNGSVWVAAPATGGVDGYTWDAVEHSITIASDAGGTDGYITVTADSTLTLEGNTVEMTSANVMDITSGSDLTIENTGGDMTIRSFDEIFVEGDAISFSQTGSFFVTATAISLNSLATGLPYIDIGLAPNTIVVDAATITVTGGMAITGSLTLNGTPVTAGGTLDSLSDVTITAAASGDRVSYNGSAWVNGREPFDIASFYPGAPTASAFMQRFIAARAITLPTSLTGSYAKCAVAATASTAFDITKNGSSVGTITFAAAGTTASFTFASPVSLAAGDILAIIAPASPDATCADISITLAGTR